MTNYRYDCRASYRGSTYTFRFALTNRGSERAADWIAYIVGEVDYGRRDSSGEAAMWVDAREEMDDPAYPRIIGWDTRVATRAEMERIARLWCRCTVMYIVDDMPFMEAAQLIEQQEGSATA